MKRLATLKSNKNAQQQQQQHATDPMDSTSTARVVQYADEPRTHTTTTTSVLPTKPPATESKMMPRHVWQTPQEYLDLKELRDTTPQALYCKLIGKEDILRWCQVDPIVDGAPSPSATAAAGIPRQPTATGSSRPTELVDDADEDLSEDERIAKFHAEAAARMVASRHWMESLWRDGYAQGMALREDACEDVRRYGRDLGPVEAVYAFTDPSKVDKSLHEMRLHPDRSDELWADAIHVQQLERDMHMKMMNIKLQAQVGGESARAEADLTRATAAEDNSAVNNAAD